LQKQGEEFSVGCLAKEQDYSYLTDPPVAWKVGLGMIHVEK
jgi:hypothetical protein